MKRYAITFIAVLALFAIVSLTIFALGGAGSTDPAVSLSRLEGSYQSSLLEQADEKTEAGLLPAYYDSFFELSQKAADYKKQSALADSSAKTAAGPLRFKAGDLVLLDIGSAVTLESGQAAVHGELSNITAGSAAAEASALTQNARYICSSEGGGVKISSSTAQLRIDGSYSLSYSGSIDYNSTADALNAMGLFKGDTTGYALERASNRSEGLVMFIRLLGEESAALSYGGTHPFTDVDPWADSYVAYAYDKGYTKGISATLFGAKDTLTTAHYVTFLMRALGYDEGTDFFWSTAAMDAKRLGLLSEADYNRLSGQSFLRSEIAYLSYYSLFTEQKNGLPLIEKLLGLGVLSEASVRAGAAEVIGSRA